MRKLARWSSSHRWYVLVGWVILLLVVLSLAAKVGTSYSNNFTIPNSDAQRAADLLEHSFPAQAGDRDEIVFKVAGNDVRGPIVRAHMEQMFNEVAKLPHVSAVISPYSAASGDKAISADGKIAFATVVFDKKANLLTKAEVQPVVDKAKAAASPGIEVELGGQAIELTEQQGFGIATAVGLLAAVVVLLLTFGSLLAMGLPIVTALFGLGTGLSLIALFTHVVDTPNFSSELAAMIGLGVGIDYSLFILTRYREAYRTPGPTFQNVRESVVQAMDTAGRAVLFAGTTVVIALLGMLVLGVEFLYGVAISASIGVLMMMLGSITLLPALLTFAGKRVARPSRRARARARRAAEQGEPTPAQGGTWLRWSAAIQRRPWVVALTSAGVMLAIAAPAVALRLGSSDASNDPAGQTTHRAYELLASGFGEGFNGPLLVVAKVPTPGSATASIEKLRAAIAATPGVVAVAPARTNPAGDVSAISVYQRSSPQAYATTQLVEHIRSQVVPAVESQTGVKVYVGGVTAGGVDFAKVLAGKLPLFIGVVVLLSALLLLTVFRSLVIPVQAAAMNLLSITAALGVIVAIFQWGWLGNVIGVQKGPIESFIPVMLFAIVFGLSMDYEVFLISRMHERWTQTRDHSRSVAEGLALTGRVVTAAAAIMVLVFLSFMLLNGRIIKEFGLSLASAVFLDALVVRCMLLPSVLHLVGPRTWWIPAWLERILPRIKIEGEALPAVEAENALHPGAQPAPGAARRAPAGVATEGAEG
ncbi:MAG TPA: MMPL family transporter [Solirubrobacteraceae bacterium]|nr:MMPL family transporter [Solirubrobacteraceae bacterium]